MFAPTTVDVSVSHTGEIYNIGVDGLSSGGEEMSQNVIR